MKRSLQLSVIGVLLVLVSGCSKPLPQLDGVDLVAWREDRKGCLGQRIPFGESIRDQRDKLKGLSEMELVELLGKPDRNDLSPRNEKFYYYFIGPAPDCESNGVEGLKLIVRFNATGISREVAIE